MTDDINDNADSTEDINPSEVFQVADLNDADFHGSPFEGLRKEDAQHLAVDLAKYAHKQRLAYLSKAGQDNQVDWMDHQEERQKVYNDNAATDQEISTAWARYEELGESRFRSNPLAQQERHQIGQWLENQYRKSPRGGKQKPVNVNIIDKELLKQNPYEGLTERGFHALAKDVENRAYLEREKYLEKQRQEREAEEAKAEQERERLLKPGAASNASIQKALDRIEELNGYKYRLNISARKEQLELSKWVESQFQKKRR